MKDSFIYIIEDDRDIRDNLTELLEAEGFNVAVAENGKVALDRLQRENFRPCLIFLDLMMPVMDGRTFLEKMMDMPVAKDIPVVVISAASEKIDFKVAGFMKKPLDLDEVLTAAFKYCHL